MGHDLTLPNTLGEEVLAPSAEVGKWSLRKAVTVVTWEVAEST